MIDARRDRPGGATGCSHGWRSPQATGTRGRRALVFTRPGGAAESFRATRTFLRPGGAESRFVPASTGCAAGLRPCAPPVATPRGPVGVEGRADANAHANAERMFAA